MSSKRSSATPKTTQSKKAKAVAEALEAFESVTATCVFGSRPARGETYIKFGWTVGQSGEHQGKQGKNLIMEFTLIEREWEGIEKTVFDRIAGHTGHWFSKAKKINFCKVKTPEVANMILLLLKEIPEVISGVAFGVEGAGRLYVSGYEGHQSSGARGSWQAKV